MRIAPRVIATLMRGALSCGGIPYAVRRQYTHPVPLDTEPPSREKADSLGIDAALFQKYPCRQRRGCVVIDDRYGRLEDDRPGIVALVNKVYGAPADLHPRF